MKTRLVRIKDLNIGDGNPVSVQSMCATPTRDEEKTLTQVNLLADSGADLVRIAVDSPSDVAALKSLRDKTKALLVVDLQENYPLLEEIAPYIDKIRYNPGHLHRVNKDTSIEDKVKWIVDVAVKHNLAIRIGVNCGSVAPDFLEKYPDEREVAIIENALWHCELMDRFDFKNYLVSLKDSDPQVVIRLNEAFAKKRPDVPLHLGVTEAGMPPEGVIKTRIALERLLSQGIGDTIRVSLTVPFDQKFKEIEAGREIIKAVREGRHVDVPDDFGQGLNIISCPSCSRVENNSFVDLAQKVKEIASFAKNEKLTIAVMGCRVNGPGETDHADIGVWCGPKTVTLKRKSETLGTYSFDDVLPAIKEEIKRVIIKP